MAEQVLQATIRESLGTGAVKRLRKSGWVPGVIYGRGSESVPVQLNNQELVRFLHTLSSEHTLIKLKVKNKNEDVMIQDIQYHPYKNMLVHVDFHKVAMDEKLTTVVPVQDVGEAKGVVSGGVLEHAVRELKVECYPKDLPSVIEIDISELEIGQSIHISDLPVPSGVRFLDDPDLSVVSVLSPIVQEEAEGEESEEVEETVDGSSAEPELIRKREKEEEE